MGSAQEVGRLGEDIACRFVISRGLRVIRRNVRYREGELDIVAVCDGDIHFIEVKTRSIVSCETSVDDGFVCAVEHIDTRKYRRIRQCVSRFMADNLLYRYHRLHIDAVLVVLKTDVRTAHVQWMGDIVPN